jgi:hypothetical protein
MLGNELNINDEIVIPRLDERFKLWWKTEQYITSLNEETNAVHCGNVKCDGSHVIKTRGYVGQDIEVGDRILFEVRKSDGFSYSVTTELSDWYFDLGIVEEIQEHQYKVKDTLFTTNVYQQGCLKIDVGKRKKLQQIHEMK